MKAKVDRRTRRRRTAELLGFASLRREIEGFWTDPRNRKGSTWMEHQDINEVMLVTSLSPDSFLSVQ